MAKLIFLKRTQKEIEIFGGDVYFDIDGKVLALNHRVKYCEYRDYFALLEE